MVLPDGTASQTRKKRTKPAVVAGVVVLGVCGALLVGSLTSPPPVVAGEETTPTTIPPPAEPTTTEPWSVARIETGDRISWRKAFELNATYPIAMVEDDSGLYLFVDDGVDHRPGPGFFGFGGFGSGRGMRGWHSPEGSFWKPLAPGIDSQFEVADVVTTNEGLLAFGRDALTRAPMTWISTDGANWEAVPLEADPEWPAESNVYLGPLVSGDGVTILFGSASVSAYEAVNTRLAERFGDVMRDLGWNHDPASGDIIAYGPMGIPVVEISPEELGITEEELVAATNGEGTSFTVAWIRTADGGWQRTATEMSQIGAGFVGPDDRIWVVSYGNTNAGVYASADGIEWERLGGTEMVGGAEPSGRFGDSYVGTQWGAFGSHLAVSADLRTWEPMGPVDDFPDDYSWNTYPVAAGAGGVAGIVQGYSTNQPSNSPPIELERDGYTLRTDPSRSSELTISFDNTLILRVGLWGSRLPDYVTIDLDARTFTFLDPLTDAPLTTFSFDELIEAEAGSGSYYGPPSALSAILYSRDGVQWTIQDFSNILRGDGYVTDLIVDDSNLFVLDIAPPAVPLDSAPHRLELWIGTP